MAPAHHDDTDDDEPNSRATTSLTPKLSAVASARSTPIRRPLRPGSQPMTALPAMVTTVPTMIAACHDSSRKMMARTTDHAGEVPTSTDVRLEPMRPIAATKRPCELPGAIAPTSANRQTSSHDGRS